MICPHCGKETSPYAKFCEACGEQISDSTSQPATVRPAAVEGPSTVNPPAPIPEIPPESRYQEYGMGDVVAQKKSHKKLIIAIVAILLAVALVISGFFIFRLIQKNQTLSQLKEAPADYLLTAYKDTAKAICSQNDVGKVISAVSDKGTSKTTTVLGSEGTHERVVSYNKETKQFYYGITAESSGQSNTTELYGDMNKLVLNTSKGTNYYLELKDLRNKAKDSIIGPDAKDGLGVPQDQYDTVMDVYEYVYSNLSKDTDDYFGLNTLIKKVCKDIDECGKVDVSEGSTDIFGSDTKAFVITHDFKDTSVLNALFLDLKTWAKDSVNINEQINKQLMDAIERLDPIQANSYLGTSEYEVVLKHYLNKDTKSLMKAEFNLTYKGQTYTVVLTFGADPATTDKLSLEMISTGMNQSFVLTNMSTVGQAKYVLKVSGAAYNGEITYTRDTSTGDFTVEQNLKPTSFTSHGETNTENAEPTTLKGNLKTTDNSFTLKVFPNPDMPDVSVTYLVSTTPEIKELNSDHDILKASKEELITDFASLATAFNPYPTFIIPSMIQSAESSTKKTNAAELNNAYKNLYAGVASGMINADTSQAEVFDLDLTKVPKPNSTVADCKAAANRLTISDAIAYGGLSSVFSSENISDYVYDKNSGSIFYSGDFADGIPLTLETTLGELRVA